MRATLYYGPGDLRIEQVPEPRPAPDEVLLRPLHNGLCGTDLHQFYVGSLSPTPLPIVVGHEFSAEVLEVGARASGVARGDLVTVDPLWTCGGCGPCPTAGSPRTSRGPRTAWPTPSATRQSTAS